MDSALDIYSNFRKNYYKEKDFRHCMFFKMVELSEIPFKLYRDNLPNYKERALLIKLIYAYFRELDDIADGDKKIFASDDFKANKTAICDYLLRRIDFIDGKSSPKGDMDILMDSILSLAHNLELDICLDCKKILESLLFDVYRTCDIQNGEISFCSKKELEKFYFEDYTACHRLCTLVTTSINEETKTDGLKALDYAQRNYYILRDFLEDLSRGLINIPMEEIGGIDEGALLDYARSLSFENKDLISICKNKGFNSLRVLDTLDIMVANWLDAKLDYSFELLEIYNKDAPFEKNSELLNEVLFERHNLADVVTNVMIERPTKSYLTMLKGQKDNMKTLKRRA